MKKVKFTIAKLDPTLWDKIKSGEKKFEIRTEEFKGTHVVFVEPDHPRNVLGIVRIKEGIHVGLHVHYEAVKHMLCELAKIDSERFDRLFKGVDTVFVHGVTPVPISVEYLKVVAGALRIFDPYYEEAHMRTHFLMKTVKNKEK